MGADFTFATELQIVDVEPTVGSPDKVSMHINLGELSCYLNPMRSFCVSIVDSSTVIDIIVRVHSNYKILADSDPLQFSGYFFPL